MILYLIAEKGMTAGQVQDLLYRKSGLKGLSGISNDVRDLLKSDDARAAFALDYFVYRIGLYAGHWRQRWVVTPLFTAGIERTRPL